MFFTNVSHFPKINDEEKIPLVPFLEASKGIVQFVEILGTVFTPVKQDINGNIEKLYKIHQSDKTKFETINDVIAYELEETNKVGIDALLWLKRALEYVQILITCLIDDTKDGSCAEDLTPFFNKAYEEKLKPYHGWFVQKLFGLIVYAAPGRKSLLLLLNDNKEISDEEIMKEAESYVNQLSHNIEIINRLYTTHNLHSNEKV
ncbi:glycolipid transfer protein [Parasteatoda tepidariorum]|uniref:glycolipid transfer protein n=1 Tax=Parasteatoda tepidariorum TaxID=114398 RepID=UPI001C71C4D7|nr:glycolipid transfer protein [Parasteatoda tepidariorum]